MNACRTRGHAPLLYSSHSARSLSSPMHSFRALAATTAVGLSPCPHWGRFWLLQTYYHYTRSVELLVFLDRLGIAVSAAEGGRRQGIFRQSGGLIVTDLQERMRLPTSTSQRHEGTDEMCGIGFRKTEPVVDKKHMPATCRVRNAWDWTRENKAGSGREARTM